MPNLDEVNSGQFAGVFKETRQPSIAIYSLTVIKQTKELTDNISQLKRLLNQANELLTNNKNLSEHYYQRLKIKVEQTTKKLADAETSLKEILNIQNDGNHLFMRG